MSIIHRFAKNSAARRPSGTIAGPRNHVEPQVLGPAGQIVCSPWEGIYLEQGRSWAPEGETDSALSLELERFLTSVLSGDSDLRGERVEPDFPERGSDAE